MTKQRPDRVIARLLASPGCAHESSMTIKTSAPDRSEPGNWAGGQAPDASETRGWAGGQAPDASEP